MRGKESWTLNQGLALMIHHQQTRATGPLVKRDGHPQRDREDKRAEKQWGGGQEEEMDRGRSELHLLRSGASIRYQESSRWNNKDAPPLRNQSRL